MTLFARNLKSAPPVPAKRVRNGVTNGELNAAIAAVCEGLSRCPTRQTLEALWALTDADDDSLVKLDGPPPVTLTQFDDALAEVAQLELPENILGPFKRVRTLLAQAEAQKAKEPAQYVTVAQLKAHDAALFDAFGWALGAINSELNRSQPSQARVLELLNRSASSPERKKLLAGIREFREADVPKITPEEWLRYQALGPR